MRKVPVMGWIFSPQNLYVEILNLSTSKCSLIWGKARAFREVIKIRWGQEGQFFSKIKGNLTIKKYMCISIYLSIYLSVYLYENIMWTWRWWITRKKEIWYRGFPHRLHKEPTPPTNTFWTSSLQNCKSINFS